MKKQYSAIAKISYTIVPLVFLLAVASGCATAGKAATVGKTSGTVISAVKTSGRFAIDGKTNEAAWNDAQAVTVPLKAEAGVEAKKVTLRAVYDNENIYMAAEYADATPVKMNKAWVYDGTTWKKGSYDDTLAFVWNMDDSVAGFNDRGLSVMTTPLVEGADVFDFQLAASGDAAAKSKADFWGW